MPTTTISKIADHVGKEVRLSGWVAGQRSSGKIRFILLRDGTGTIQCVVSRTDVGDEMFERCQDAAQESSVRIDGTVREDARSPIGFELSVSSVEIIQVADGYPIGRKEHGEAFLLDHRHLWLRSSRQQAILRIRDAFVFAIREFLHERGFLCLDTPILTPNAVEGTTTLFETEYFGETAYLAQSGQLYNEATAMAFRNVYCFGPTFRAEKSKTRRHLTEFWMVEPEMAFADLDECMSVMEEFIVATVERVVARCAAELEILERAVEPLKRVQSPFPRVHYRDAARRLRELGLPFEEGNDFGAPDETELSAEYDRPFFVHHYPASVKAFYMKRDPDDESASLSVDLLAPEGYGEIVGGGQREDDLDLLESRIREHELPMSAFGWYLDLRRFGSVPHSGFGLGDERTLTWLCGLDHLRETIPFPRMIHRHWP